MLGLAPQRWAHLAGISGGENIYLGSRIIIKNYPALSAAIGGRDGMDAGRALWMTLPFWELPSKLMLGLLLGSMGSVFQKEKDILLATLCLITFHLVI